MIIIPVIDPNVRHVRVSELRRLNAERLRELTDTLVVDGFDGEKPFVVIVPYATFQHMQQRIAEKELREGNIA